MERHLPELPLIDRVKIQAEVLVPVVRQLQAELGTEAAERIVRTALSESWRAERGASQPSTAVRRAR